MSPLDVPALTASGDGRNELPPPAFQPVAPALTHETPVSPSTANAIEKFRRASDPGIPSTERVANVGTRPSESAVAEIADRARGGERGSTDRDASDASQRESSERPLGESGLAPSTGLHAERAAQPDPPAGLASGVRAPLTTMHAAAPAPVQGPLLAAIHAEIGAAPAPVAPAPDTSDRIVQSMRLQFVRGGGDAVLHLQPEHLGPVGISLRVENGAVTATITADHPAVAEWLQSNQQSLREGLQASGLHLERFVVQRDGQSPGDRQRREWLDARRRDLRRRSPQSDSTFEISM